MTAETRAAEVLADLMAAVYGDAEGVDPEEQAEIKRRMTAVLAARDDREGAAVRALLAEGVAAEREPCRLDHNGDCQEHGWSGGECWVARVRVVLASPVTPDGGDQP